MNTTHSSFRQTAIEKSSPGFFNGRGSLYVFLLSKSYLVV